MKKLVKWLLRIVLSLVILVILAAFIIPMVIDPNDYKENIAEKIEQQIGRPAQLNGNIEWSVFPWLALTINEISIDNEAGFTGEKFASINQLSARVKLLPLISKNIEVGSIVINEAHFTLQVSASGKSNWQGILDHVSQSSTDTEPTDSSSTLNIQGVQIKNTSIDYSDKQSSTQANISKMSMDMSEIAIDKLVKTDISMHINMPESGFDADLNSDLSIHNLLNNAGIKVDINGFKLNGQLSSSSETPINISFDEKGLLDLAQDTLNIPRLNIRAGDANINTNISANNLTKNIQMTGNYVLNEFNLNQFFKQLSGSTVVSSDVFDKFSSKGSWKLFKNALNIDNLDIKFEDSEIKGAVNIANLDNLKGTFQLDINRINIDKFLADSESSSATNSSNTESELNFGNLTGTVKIKSVNASGTTIENLTMQVKTNGATMTLDPVTGDFYSGGLNTSVKVDTKSADNKISVGHSMSKIQAGPLLNDLSGSELLTGIGDLNIDLSIDEPFSEVPMKSANGHINYNLGNGAIYGVDVFGMIQQGLSLIYPEVEPLKVDGVKKTTFALMEIDADINQGILSTNVLKVSSPYLLINGDVNIDLANMTIEGTISPMLLDIPEQLVSDKYKKLLKVAIPVSLSGSLLEPNIKIDAKQLLLNSQKERIEEEKEKLKGKLLDSLFGGKNKDEADDGN
ncbi:MAG: AsmA family protein [Marinicellaceae bacterium]